MSVASQPIAVTPNRVQQDPSLCAGYPSFSPRNFFGGSPMSFKTGSFQNRFYPGASPGHQLGPIAMPDFKRGMPSSWEGDASAWLNAVKNDVSATDDELCRNYTCCGNALPDLHALVEHFESNHVEIVWPFGSEPDSNAASPDDSGSPAFDADDMDLEPSEPSPSPPATPSPNSPLMQSPSSATPYTSAFDPIRVVSLSSATGNSSPLSAFFTTPNQFHSNYSSLAGANGGVPVSAFNRYAGYSDYSSNLPGTDPSPIYPDVPKEARALDDATAAAVPSHGRCLPPSMLFSSSASPSPLNTPAPSRTGSPTSRARPSSIPTGTLPLHPASASGSSSGTAYARGSSGTSGARPSSSLTLQKPFRCPKPGCNKTYKQQNGLKYHLSHGQCNFAPRDPEVEKLSEVERDKRLRPFVCKVGTECGRRYKNMNGLRYHYTHTGDHGAIGLEMLAQGRHPLPDVPTGSSSSGSSSRPKPLSSETSNNNVMYQQRMPPRSGNPAYYSPSVNGSLVSANMTNAASAAQLVSTVPVPAPVSLVLSTAHQQHSRSHQHSPAPSPLSPFHAPSWMVGGDEEMMG